MKNSRPFFARAILALLLLLISVPFSIAETIELVTYYPVPGNTGDQHAKSLTVGNAPYSINNPAEAVLTDGTLLVADRVGLGQGAVVDQPILHHLGEHGYKGVDYNP